MIALFAAGDVAIPEYDTVVKEEAMEGVQQQHEEEETAPWNSALVDQRWSWTETFPCMPEPMHDATWSPSPSREEVV